LFTLSSSLQGRPWISFDGTFPVWNVFWHFCFMQWRFLFLVLLPFLSFTQLTDHPKFGWKAGATFQFGTHTNNFGIHFNAFFADRFYQLNVGEQLTFRLADLGGRQRFFQSRISTGLVLLTGKENAFEDFQLNGLFHNTKRNLGLAYNYLWYHDNVGTSQRSGGWGVHVKNLAFLFENDFFGGQGKDRFRTGHFALTYRMSSWKYSAGFSIWTGETAGTNWTKVSYDGCPNGFRILEDRPFGNTSHGLAYMGFDYKLGNYGHLGYKLGIDSEKLRHRLQNRAMHDLVWLPKKIKRNTPHYPILDQNGCPVFRLKDARPSLLYFHGGLNDNWSY
jgi:hypothetical protein